MPSSKGVSGTSVKTRDARVEFNGDADKILNGVSVDELYEKALEIKGRVKLPSRPRRPAEGPLELMAIRGVGPRGAFAQVIMRGRGALAIEFGTRRRRAAAPLRRAL